ncbi:vasoactive intestinal polypeptide receptor 1 isoform X6 [Rousettus aegyptiacus]|uniref:vasoactive intestinal polypeptide receptor 1 isoform X6 n=1 Tax=Rousettus aegyptiacus TaxID=9407 RepID=UPI00168D1250|nr:vasoactive intestinal polypeptide receptor 1 isoform X6 [Rousettus aegyptiacus]
MRPPSPPPAPLLCLLAGALACSLRPASGWASVLQLEACDYMHMIEKEHKQCLEEAQLENETAGCSKMWDNITCWPATPRGQVVILACPTIYQVFSHVQAAAGNVLYLCEDRLHHRLRPVPRHSSGCHGHLEPVQVGCKAAMVLFQYCVMANFFWLLVEGLYLHTLLAVSFFSERKYFWGYILIGWGLPSTFTVIWTISRIHFEDYGCWNNINSLLWWILKVPILTSILVNFILFIRIIRILVQKLRPPDVRKSDSSSYSRLTKSTLLLIPLFGVHYAVFAFFPDNFNAEVKMIFELVVGSFQGSVVAILYCFLNGEVQAELRRKLWRWNPQSFLGRGSKYHHPAGGSNGATCSTQVSLLTRVSPSTRRSSSFQAEDSLV